MRLLALDAATERCSVALLTPGGLVERCVDSGKAHAEQLLSMVRAVLDEAGVSLSDLDCIVASIGPGAFTGVRVSVAVAQGLAFGAGLRIIGISTLEALAMQAMSGVTPHGPNSSIAVLDARMQEVYWGCFEADAALGVIAIGTPRVTAPQAVLVPSGRCIGIGRGFAAYPALRGLPGIELPPGAEAALPRAREFAQLGALRLAQGQAMDPAEVQPVYLRDKVAQTEAERAARSQRGAP